MSDDDMLSGNTQYTCCDTQEDLLHENRYTSYLVHSW